jgi:hypothetical protein
MVVPLLCVLVLVFVDFAKAMNYWLDLNHVAMEGARKAAVNTYPTAGDYQTYVRDRLETTELKSGGHGLGSHAADCRHLPARGRRCRRPGHGAGEGRLRLDPVHPLGDFTIKGTATMRLEQKADFSAVGRARESRCATNRAA